jgi:hypothetical protein
MTTALWLLAIQGIIGCFLSGARDIYAALDLPHGGWPWNAEKAEGR